MNKFLTILCTILTFSLFTFDADAARRLGGGGNFGAQRSITPQPAKPSAPQAAPAAPAPAPVATPQPSGMSRWLGPLAGLAIGAGLASLFMNNGMGGGIGGIFMMLLLAAAAMFAWRMFRTRSTGGARLQYAGADAASAPYTPAPTATGGMPKIGSALGGGAEPATVPGANRFPPGFDAEQFARHAKTNFARLQEANDKRDVSTMRDYMTPGLFAAINAQIDPMGVVQHTEIINLDAEVIEVVTENSVHIASVRFTGSLRDKADPQAESFDEIWHLEKPLDGSSGWLISGIQQV
jgi:predicted lipid-binding transport protein (Tim44 family)